jgi:hypothetical protein
VTADVARRTRLRGGRRLHDGHVVYWWVEVLAVLGFYFVYSAIRNANEGGMLNAFNNAKRIITLEHHLGIFHEETLQRWALHVKPLIIASNYFYGSLHFVVTIGVGIWLFRRFSDDYPRFRNTLAITTAVALIGFIMFPLMPPRLLPASYGFVDTLEQYPTLWSFNSGAASKISNQYAAMPSVHVAWAIWCTLALVPRLSSRVGKWLAISYPIITVVVIVLTGNHFVIDAAGGFAILAIGWVAADKLTRAGRGPAVGVA